MSRNERMIFHFIARMLMLSKSPTQNNKWNSKLSVRPRKIIKSARTEMIYLILTTVFYLLFLNVRSDILFNFLPEKGYLITSKARNQRIFDTWMYNNEAEMAYIRLWRLYDYVDAFIICVSNISHSGAPKRLSFKPFGEDIKKYQKKIHIVYVPKDYCDPANNQNSHAWCVEKSQRDYAINYIEKTFHPTTNDIILVSDVDEIFTRDAVKFIANHPPLEFYLVPGVTYFPYYFHYLDDWHFSLAVRYSKERRHISSLRNYANFPNFSYYMMAMPRHSVTHCTYCFKSIQQYKNKLASFAHQEYNQYPYTSNDWIFKSHYCREKIGSGNLVNDEENTDYSELIPEDGRLSYLYDPSFRYDIRLTSYKEKDLETLCKFKFNRTPFKDRKKKT